MTASSAFLSTTQHIFTTLFGEFVAIGMKKEREGGDRLRGAPLTGSLFSNPSFFTFLHNILLLASIPPSESLPLSFCHSSLSQTSNFQPPFSPLFSFSPQPDPGSVNLAVLDWIGSCFHYRRNSSSLILSGNFDITLAFLPNCKECVLSFQSSVP